MRRRAAIYLLGTLNVLLISIVVWQALLLRAQRAALTQVESEHSESAISSEFGSAEPAQLSDNLSSNRDGRLPSNAHPAEAASVQGATAFATTNWPKFDWRQIESEDYRAYMQNLRDIGCPEPTLRDIVTADVLQAFAAKRAETMAARYRDFTFWKAEASETLARQDLVEKRRVLDEEMAVALHELLGAAFVPPAAGHEWKAAELDQQLTFLSPDKQEQARALLLQFAEIDRQVGAFASGMNLTENLDERRRIMDAYDYKQAELKRLLSPDEFELVALTTSWTSENLRRATVNFHPTEEEFRLLFHAWQAHDEKLARLKVNGEPTGNLRGPLRERIRELIGEERADQFWRNWWN